MSYDFVVLAPEAVGTTDNEILAAATHFESAGTTADGIDPRIAALRTALAQITEATSKKHAWISTWPAEPKAQSLLVSVRPRRVEPALMTLLPLCARHGLVLADCSSQVVHRPAPGIPIAVRGGDGTYLGALSRERLTSLIWNLAGEDPYLLLENGGLFAQTMRESDGSFVLEHFDGSQLLGTTVTSPDDARDQLWNWLTADPAFGKGLTFALV